jgi:hypothetical protein
MRRSSSAVSGPDGAETGGVGSGVGATGGASGSGSGSGVGVTTGGDGVGVTAVSVSPAMLRCAQLGLFCVNPPQPAQKRSISIA